MAAHFSRREVGPPSIVAVAEDHDVVSARKALTSASDAHGCDCNRSGWSRGPEFIVAVNPNPPVRGNVHGTGVLRSPPPDIVKDRGPFPITVECDALAHPLIGFSSERPKIDPLCASEAALGRRRRRGADRVKLLRPRHRDGPSGLKGCSEQERYLPTRQHAQTVVAVSVVRNRSKPSSLTHPLQPPPHRVSRRWTAAPPAAGCP